MQSVREGHQNVSQRAAEQIEQYVKNAVSIVQATAENINHAGLQVWQEERILENYANRFEEFNELTLYDVSRKVLATTRLGKNNDTSFQDEALEKGMSNLSYLSPVYIKEDLSPAMKVAFPVKKLAQVTGVLVGEINLMQMWYLVDGIRVGEHGYLNVIDSDQKLIASGNGSRKKEVFSKSAFDGPWRQSLHPGGVVYSASYGEDVLAIGFQTKEPLSWAVIVEQPVSEAYGLAKQMTVLLIAVMVSFILLAMGVGVYAGKSQVLRPIRQLMAATRQFSLGNLDYHVSLTTGDEFEVLAGAFNEMSVRLKDIQKKLLVEERHALFGRVASGLAHDLKHPIQAVETTSRLMEKMYGDEEFRKTFRRTVEREFNKINQFLNDLHNLVHETPFHPGPLQINEVVRDALATFEAEAQKRNVELHWSADAADPTISGVGSDLNRVFSNMVSNAIQAMPQGGSLNVEARSDGFYCFISFRDTGVGIPEDRLKTLFDDFVTTKSRGLGLGLAITKKIISAHQGKIEVSSELKKGTCFKIALPLYKGDKNILP